MEAGDNGSQDPQQLGDDLSNELKALGFEPGWPVMELGGFEFGIDRIVDALVKSTYRKPVVIPFYYEQSLRHDITGCWLLDTVPELVQAIYVPYQAGIDDRPLGCHEDPKWYVRGRLVRSGFDPQPGMVDRVHVLLEVMETGQNATIDICLVQLVRYDRPDADPEAPLLWLDPSQAPGQD